MATTANPPEGSFIASGDEDIAAIAKQISDHAEVIYQTWKARGLAPNEILTCHNNLKADEKFGSVLHSPLTEPSSKSSQFAPMTDFLYNNRPTPTSVNAGDLEHLVNKFAVEDKTKLVTRQSGADPSGTAKNYSSSIQYALRKFEKKSPPDTTIKFAFPSAAKGLKGIPRFSNGRIENNPPEAFVPVSNAPQMVRPLDETDSKSNGTSMWPLKNKSEQMCHDVYSNEEGHEVRSTTLPSRTVKCDDYMDEVAKEEEKLINALKTGIVISSNDSQVVGFRKEGSRVPSSDQLSLQLKHKPSIVTETIESLARWSNPSESTMELCDPLKMKRRAAAPTPLVACLADELVNGQSKTNIRPNGNNNQYPNPVRPFLTRGSVAERVMLFEKCPTEILEKRTKASNFSWKNLASDVHSKIQNYTKEANQRKNAHPPHTTLQRHTKANKNVFIPRFYFPNGKPISQQQQNLVFKNIEDIFQSLPNFQATKEQFTSVTKASGCPLYWKAALFAACGGEKLEVVDMDIFLEYWRDLTAVCHDEASRFMRIITRSAKRSYIIPEDLITLVQDVVNTHPGLTFLKQAPEFHSRYVHTVICRVYYSVNLSWNGQITLAELRKSDFLRAVQLLEEEEDINQITAYFSYEHFYVIYCKFWELDRDHDLFISKEDLARHSDHALSSRIIDRIFSRTKSKSRNSILQEGKMSYTDFVIFLLAEEDKRHPRAIEYWFRCMDIDGDGFLSMYELEHFYDEQLQRMEAMGIECLPFEDCLCQMLDMIQPKISGKISLSDLKRCKMTPMFFDTFFNLEKYLDHEQRDPFASQRDNENEMSDWDRYAAEEYELLVAEECVNEPCEDLGQYRLNNGMDRDRDDDDIFSSNLDQILSGPRESVNNKAVRRQNNNYLVEDTIETSMLSNDYRDSCNHNGGLSDSSDDYAGDSDDCSL